MLIVRFLCPPGCWELTASTSSVSVSLDVSCLYLYFPCTHHRQQTSLSHLAHLRPSRCSRYFAAFGSGFEPTSNSTDDEQRRWHCWDSKLTARCFEGKKNIRKKNKNTTPTDTKKTKLPNELQQPTRGNKNEGNEKKTQPTKTKNRSRDAPATRKQIKISIEASTPPSPEHGTPLLGGHPSIPGRQHTTLPSIRPTLRLPFAFIFPLSFPIFSSVKLLTGAEQSRPHSAPPSPSPLDASLVPLHFCVCFVCAHTHTFLFTGASATRQCHGALPTQQAGSPLQPVQKPVRLQEILCGASARA